ncbi:hypothetical protein HOLleu_10645 [Holothuria leucospilota]|uniref:Uncharacterized protein n=1 Tax=Holothuria leucospilota TaxID=206669 RepID=A0A9Q1CDV6_HOLLE|nr:hypothetical protein HOLleu_10645 [Holothuria leucospilota]
MGSTSLKSSSFIFYINFKPKYSVKLRIKIQFNVQPSIIQPFRRLARKALPPRSRPVKLKLVPKQSRSKPNRSQMPAKLRPRQMP